MRENQEIGIEVPERFILDVRDWETMKDEALCFLEQGDVEGVRQTADGFIGNSHIDRREEEAEKEERIRKAVLAFVYEKEFENADLEKQIELIKDACSKRTRYYALQSKAWRELDRARNREELFEAARRYDELVVAEGMEPFHEGGTFVEQARQKIGEKPERRPQRILPKPRAERQLGKEMSSVLSPRPYNFLVMKDGTVKFRRKEKEGKGRKEVSFEIQGLSDRAELMLDFLFDRHAKKENGKLLKTRPKPADIATLDTFEKAVENPSSYDRFIRSVKFTSAELRKELGIRITDKEVVRAVEELACTEIKLEGKRIWWDGKEKRFRNITMKSTIIDTIVIDETGKTAPRTGDPQHKFAVTFSLGWSMVFDNSIISKLYSCFPPAFYKASAGARKLGRYISCFPKGILKLGEACNILGYKGQVKNLTNRKRNIEGKLDELKRIGIIKSWKRDKAKGADGRLKELKGAETRWKIVRK